METKVKETFDELFKIQENNHCFECGENADTWTSVNNGIFLCDQCAIAHQKFGVNVSSIRRITDPWSDFHLSMMVNGGNIKLRDFFDKYYIPKDGPMNFKYRTKAGYFYRKQLRALCEGTIVPEPIDPNQALDIDTEADPNEVPDYEKGYTATTPGEESNLNKMYSFIGKQFNKTVVNAKETAKVMNEKVRESQYTAEVNDGIQVVFQETKNLASFMNEKVQNVQVSQNLKDIGSKIGATAKSGWMGAFSMFQKFTGKEEPQTNVVIEGNLETVYSVENPSSIEPIGENKNVLPQESESPTLVTQSLEQLSLGGVQENNSVQNLGI